MKLCWRDMPEWLLKAFKYWVWLKKKKITQVRQKLHHWAQDFWVIKNHTDFNNPTYLCCLRGGCALLLLPFLLLLLQLFNALFKHIRPKITFKVWQLIGTGQPVFCCLLENILNTETQDSNGNGATTQQKKKLRVVLTVVLTLRHITLMASSKSWLCESNSTDTVVTLI